MNHPLGDESRWTVTGRFDCDRCGVGVTYHRAACIVQQIETNTPGFAHPHSGGSKPSNTDYLT